MNKIILIVVLFFMAGCSVEPKIEYREKLVPTKCTINMPMEPEYTGIEDLDVQNLAIYAEVLKKYLIFCRTGLLEE